MFKRILLLLILISNVTYSQLSDKHWIPPLHAKGGENYVNDHYLYISTPEITPFQVTITNGAGIQITGSPFTISQGNPQRITIGNTQPSVMFLGLSDVNTIENNKGLILEGEGEFYASFRVRSANHAETLVSKGRLGQGNSFRLGSLPQNSSGGIRNFVASFMATQDNTLVTVDDYDVDIVFESGSGNILLDSQTFNLNEGESVTLTGYIENDFANYDGFVGAQITSNNPIVVNTGNCLGGMGTDTDGQDFALDQIVPVNQVGSEYILVRGNGSNISEFPLVIATEDNTEIFVNGDLTPVSTINAGDYFLVPNTFYQGINNKNMYITSNKPVYMYQIIAGSQSDATNGLNFIPPLSCFFQKSVDLIPSINQIGNVSYTSDVIALTYATATLSINGVITSVNSEPVIGNTEWVTYKIPNLSGNVVINSSEPLAVGVLGASGAAGFGGYYSGFGSTPSDTNVDLCSNDMVNLFDLIIGNPEPGGTWTIPTGGQNLNGNLFDASVNIPGDYFYNFSKVCDNSNQVISIKITVNIEQAKNAGEDNTYNTCTNGSAVDLYSLLGNNVTIGGTWSPMLASGSGIFNPAIDVSGNYTYSFPASGPCPAEFSTITVTNNPIPTAPIISNYELCDDDSDGNDTNGFVLFDLNIKTSEILTNLPGYSVTYHNNSNEAIAGTNPITSIYANNQIIFVRITNSTDGCYIITNFNLIVKPKPVINNIVTLKQCDTDTDAITIFNLTEANTLISPNTNYTFTYHNSETGANLNNDFVTDEISHLAANGSSVWARIINVENCFRVAEISLLVSTTTVQQNYRYTVYECDDFIDSNNPDNDGFDFFNLTEIETQLINQFPLGQSYNFTYYLNQSDAETEQNEITNFTNFKNTIANSQLIWVRIDSNINNECVGLGSWLELIVNPLPVVIVPDFVLCIDPTTGIGSQTIDATPTIPGNYSYVWTPQNLNGNSPIYNISSAGIYTVNVINNDTNCEDIFTITTTFSSEPETFEANLITPAFSSGLATIEAMATGGFGIYEYSIDAVNWQSSPIFSDLQNGSYIVYVRDIQGCGVLFSEELQTITYPNYFTPNGDGYNDYWNIRLPNEYEGLISIYDRYGKLLKQLSAQGQGWDGTFNGNILPSTDYWFKVEYFENNKRKEFKSHFSLKR